MTNEEINRYIAEAMGLCVKSDYKKVSYNKAQVGADVSIWECQNCNRSGGLAEQIVYRQGVPRRVVG